MQVQLITPISPNDNHQIDVNNFISSIKQLTIEEQIEGKADPLVQKILTKCLETKNRQMFCDLCYALFSGEKQPNQLNKNFILLGTLIISDYFFLEDILTCFPRIFESWKTEAYKHSKPTINTSKEWSHASALGYGEGESIYCVHGGGLNHMTEWLNGSEKAGYNCDSLGKGIFVTPIPKNSISDNIFQITKKSFFNFFDSHKNLSVNRTELYALRNPASHFDSPCYACFKVKPNVLRSAADGNGYEAILLSKDIDRIENIRKERLEWLSSPYSENIMHRYSHFRIINYSEVIGALNIEQDVKERLLEGIRKLDFDYKLEGESCNFS